MTANGSTPIEVFIESGGRRVFASALDWPGWARSGKTEDQAVVTLADYLPRYAEIVRLAGMAMPDGPLVVVERHAGVAKNADFGALGEVAQSGKLGCCHRPRGPGSRACWKQHGLPLTRPPQRHPPSCAKARAAAVATPTRSLPTSGTGRHSTRAR